MAFLATLQIELRTTGSDTNGGAFDSTAGVPGTDYSQQDAAQVTFTDLVIGATTTQCTSVLNPFTAAYVGNVINITSGAGFTVQRVQIISVSAGVATCDKSLGTTASTGGNGKLGGGLATLGTVGSLPLVAGNIIWIKYHATNVYTTTNTTSNIANGRFASSVAIGMFGYEVTHGDNTGNRPTLKWGVNAASSGIITVSSASLQIANIIFDGNRASFTATRGLNYNTGSGTVWNCKFMACSSLGVGNSAGSDCSLIDCEFTDCSTGAVTMLASAVMYMFNCFFHDQAAVSVTIGRLFAARCVFDTQTGSAVTVTGSPPSCTFTECTFYNSTTDAVSFSIATSFAKFTNCVFENNGGYGVGLPAGSATWLVMTGCAFYNNTSGPYDTSKTVATQILTQINNTTGTFFVDAPNQNFTPNTTANQGALIRGVAVVLPGSATTSYTDKGATQHQDTGGGGSTGGSYTFVN